MNPMSRKVLVGGSIAAAIVGAGGTALAVSGSGAANGAPSANSTTAASHPGGDRAGRRHPRRAGKARVLRRLEHGQIVTRGKDGAVTHDLINGTVTAVSATSITVRAEDKTSQTFVVTEDTRVRERSRERGTKPAESSIGKVAEGDHVFVAGTGAGKATARAVVELPK